MAAKRVEEPVSASELEKKIATALANKDIGSSNLAALIAETETAIAAADQAAEAEREKALDPALSPDPKAAREAIEAAEFARDRLRTLLPWLQELQAQEFLAQWHADYEGLKVVRDTLAAELREVYPPYAKKIADFLDRIAVNDAALSRLHQARPAGVALHLLGAELAARGLDGFTRFEPSIAADFKLPDWGEPTKFVWPPPQTLLALLAVKGMEAAVDHAGDNWWQRRGERQR
jgi:hypothetical protein